jgi:hypothetical protein
MLRKHNFSRYSRYIGHFRRLTLLSALLFLLPSSVVLVILSATPARANIFAPALNAMNCIVTSASTGGGVSNALLPKLPGLIFGAIALFIFAYILICLNQIFQAVRNGEEITNVVIPFMSSFVGLLVIMIFQNLLFGSGGC